MNIPPLPPFPQTLPEATTLQEQLRSQVISQDQLGKVQYVAGGDLGFDDPNHISQGAVVVLSYPDLKLVDQAIVRCPIPFPYVPGFLSFREIPVLIQALEKLTVTPDLILCDGQGMAHPRRFGLACHLGVLLDIPTIGVAKSLYIGSHDPVPPERGSWQPLIDQGETLGAVLRSRTGVKPLYVSIGHRISLPTAIQYVLACTPQYRLPETTRWADHLASQGLDNPHG